LALAAVAGASRLVFSPRPHPSPAAIRWAYAVRAYRDVTVVAPSAGAQRAFLRREVPVERCHVVRPGVDFSKVNRRRDAGLRSALGIGPDDFVILAPGESTIDANHRLATWTASILRVLDPRVRLLLWGRGPMADQAAGLGAKLGQPNMVVRAEERLGRRVPFESLLPATDAALVTATGPAAALPVAVCMAAALPIVATAEPTVAELLEDRHTCLMVPQPRARLLAERMLTLREDPSLQWRVSDTARAEAYEHWSLTRFLAEWREVYAGLSSAGAHQREPSGSAAGRDGAASPRSATF
jgi:glycosyltransferase involved in cell wall biosynthesis